MRVVLTSVNYSDFLAVTLAAWKAIVPAGCLSVATSPNDRESQRVAAEHGVPVLVTDAWTRRGDEHHGDEPTFNMALGLDEAFGLSGDLVSPPAPGEILAHANPDCYPFGKWPPESAIAHDAVYGFWRHECLSPKALALHKSGARPLAQFPKLKNSHGWPIGYFQMFRNHPGRRLGSWATAWKFDTAFSATFSRQVMLDGLYMLHLGPINVRENWAGRTVPQWGAA